MQGRPSEEWTIRRLADGLRQDGDGVELDESSGHLLIRQWGSEAFEPPAELALGDREFQDVLMRSASSGAGGYDPTIPPLQAAYELFIVHLDEVMAVAAVAGSTITAERGGLSAYPSRVPESFDLPDGDYHWSAEPGRPSGAPAE